MQERRTDTVRCLTPYFCTCDHDLRNLFKAKYRPVSISIYYSNSVLLIVNSFMENFSTLQVKRMMFVLIMPCKALLMILSYHAIAHSSVITYLRILT